MISYLESFLLGFSFGAIPGIVFFELTRRTLTKGFWSGALIAIGEFVGNFSILLLAFFGLAYFLTFTSVKIILFICGTLLLFYLAYFALKVKKKDIETSMKKKISKKGSFLVGIGLAFTNTLGIPVWIALTGTYLARFPSMFVVFMNILLLAAGVMLFFLLFALIIHYTRHRIPLHIVVWISRIFGVILVGYGIYFLYQLILLLM